MSSAARAERRRQARAEAKGPGLRLVQQRGDGDCLRAAVATVLGLELDDVPSACNGSDDNPEPVQQAWQDWAAGRGLAIHDSPAYAPIFLPRWIAMVAVWPHGEHHALVMTGDRILYDPATAPGSQQSAIDPADVLLSMIVGAPEWVAEQARQMEVLANTDPSRVWFIGPHGALMQQMIGGLGL